MSTVIVTLLLLTAPYLLARLLQVRIAGLIVTKFGSVFSRNGERRHRYDDVFIWTGS
ncbi:hypothetical protein RY831_00920 [Noviherbaspirillum sp. CPCC 100848]|uniref:Uncharacterized protein n=1 Tax=Noviherbaspirillum album TaxID=3080276 RepID=A0ABU6J3B3_9BURK|nr:hypothetical protein [Noviherbaspirillum sp. CPCC 100848]MEC4717704.1 hypothetical protein [Noviherbaspirillum sp. CPCC 100848]